jgi:hypothetical protein
MIILAKKAADDSTTPTTWTLAAENPIINTINAIGKFNIVIPPTTV